MTVSGKSATDSGTKVMAGPKIDALDPPSGSTAGGTQVTIKGSLLRNVETVFFGAKSVRPSQPPTDTMVIAVSPPNAPDTVMVHVVDYAGNPSNSLPFTYKS